MREILCNVVGDPPSRERSTLTVTPSHIRGLLCSQPFQDPYPGEASSALDLGTVSCSSHDYLSCLTTHLWFLPLVTMESLCLDVPAQTLLPILILHNEIVKGASSTALVWEHE